MVMIAGYKRKNQRRWRRCEYREIKKKKTGVAISSIARMQPNRHIEGSEEELVTTLKSS